MKITLLSIISLFTSGVMTDESVSVYEGDSVTLHTNIVIQKDQLIEWRFEKKDLIARINWEANSLKIYDDVLDGRFRGRLKMNTENGDLTIKNTTTQHTGIYQLEITNKEITTKTFIFSVSGDKDKVKTVMKGDSVILVNNVIKKPGDEKMMWRIQHNNSTVAEIEVLHADVHERFRDRLYVNVQTGNLIITNIRPDDFGSYEVDITVGSHIYTIHRLFHVKEQDQSSGSRSRLVTTAVICVVALLLLAVALAVAVFYYKQRSGKEHDVGGGAAADGGGGAAAAAADVEIETDPVIEGTSATPSREDPVEKRGEDPVEKRREDPVEIEMSLLPKSSQ